MNLETAKQLLKSAEEAATSKGYQMSFVVVDAAGHDVALHRMDGAGFLSPRVAQAKGFTAAATGGPTASLKEGLSQAPYFVTASTVLTDGKFLAGGGGMPIRSNGNLIGGMGASGGSAVQDAEIVEQALREVSTVDDPDD